MKHKTVYLLWPLFIAAGVFILWELNPPSHQKINPITDALTTSDVVSGPIQPIPQQLKLDPNKVSLGRKLFNDPRLSKDNSVSCSTCHNLDMGGADNRQYALGIDNAVGELNTPTVYNSLFNFKQFWDGRADTLEEQVRGPIHNPKEMGSNWEEVIAKLKRDTEYPRIFGDIYAEGINEQSIADAIATFEASLYTPDSRFDHFLRGDDNALTPTEKTGYQMFQDLGCIVCHQGINIGGNSFQTMGKLGDYFKGKEIRQSDLGRYNVTGSERDRHKFKVPTLRNISLTAPYFHDGSADTLEEAVLIMSRYQLGYELSKAEVDHLVAFLKTLTGTYQGKPLTPEASRP